MVNEKDNLVQQLAQICGSKNIIQDQRTLKDYSEDLGFLKGKIPKLLIKVSKTKQIIEILKLANLLKFS